MKSIQSACSQYRGAYLLRNVDFPAWTYYKNSQGRIPTWARVRTKEYNKSMRRSAERLMGRVR